MTAIVQKYKILLSTILSILFVAVNLVLISRFDFYYLLGLPLILMIIYFYFFSYEKIIWLILLFTPIAVNLSSFDIGLSVSLPTEPLLAGLLLLFIFRIFTKASDAKIYQHPISIVLLIQLFWMLFTSISSEYPLVSLKYLAARLWFIFPFFFMLIPLMRKRKNILNFFWIYTFSLIIVIAYTFYRHSLFGFTEESGHWVMSPFYNDHTAYGAILAFIIPFYAVFSFKSKLPIRFRLINISVFIILAIALVFSSSRAAWISVVASMGVWFLVRFKINLKWVLTGFLAVLLLFFYYQDDLVYMLERNKQESSENMAEHVQSISNISSDDSNLERINRWQAAFRLFNERPVLGWGPGTYQFVYAPYQKAKEKTSISTNAGNMGSVHSEFLGPLAEMGIFGMLIVVVLLIYVFKTAVNIYGRTNDADIKTYSLISILAMSSYFTHGLLNNFLETDKLAIPVYGLMAIIVALDIYSKKNPDQKARI